MAIIGLHLNSTPVNYSILMLLKLKTSSFLAKTHSVAHSFIHSLLTPLSSVPSSLFLLAPSLSQFTRGSEEEWFYKILYTCGLPCLLLSSIFPECGPLVDCMDGVTTIKVSSFCYQSRWLFTTLRRMKKRVTIDGGSTNYLAIGCIGSNQSLLVCRWWHRLNCVGFHVISGTKLDAIVLHTFNPMVIACQLYPYVWVDYQFLLQLNRLKCHLIYFSTVYSKSGEFETLGSNPIVGQQKHVVETIKIK